jgi:glycosyltransferase involved in cell wall biosynthesis
MRISGLSFIRNGVSLGYPFTEAIRSILPLVDEMIVVVGASEDGTREAVAAIDDPRLRIIDTVWPSQITPKACVLAQQTNVGLLQCSGDWVVYVQGCEVFHERDLPALRRQMETHLDDPGVEGLLVERRCFYGDPQHLIRAYPDRYKYVVRAFKPWNGVYSVGDAMSFRVFDNYGKRGRVLRAVDSGIEQYRYSKALPPRAMEFKRRHAPHVLQAGATFDDHRYYTEVPRDFICPYRGDHPAVMQDWIAAHPIRLDDQSPHWRTAVRGKERLRLLETAWYARYGLPRWRHGRYHLVGDFVRKDRGAEALSTWPLQPASG